MSDDSKAAQAAKTEKAEERAAAKAERAEQEEAPQKSGKPRKITLACAYYGTAIIGGEEVKGKWNAGDEVTLSAAELEREPNLDADSPDNQRVAQLVAMQQALTEAGGRPELRDKLAFTLAAAKPRAPRAAG